MHGILSLRIVGATPQGDIYLDEPWVSIRWDGVHHFVHTEWKAFANSVEFRSALMTALDAIRERGAAGYLSDTRNIKVVVPKDQAWANEVWIPLLVAAGIQRFALVTAESGLGKLTVEEVIKLVDNRGLRMRSFGTLSEAQEWLTESDPSQV